MQDIPQPAYAFPFAPPLRIEQTAVAKAPPAFFPQQLATLHQQDNIDNPRADTSFFINMEATASDPATTAHRLKLDVSGQAVEIKGALLLNDAKEPRLVLTSQTNGCNRDSFSDVTVELRYKGTSDLTLALLMGNRVDSAYQTSLERDLKGFKTKIPAKLPKVGSKLDIPLDGEVPLPADYKIKLSGTVTALVCKP